MARASGAELVAASFRASNGRGSLACGLDPGRLTREHEAPVKTHECQTTETTTAAWWNCGCRDRLTQLGPDFRPSPMMHRAKGNGATPPFSRAKMLNRVNPGETPARPDPRDRRAHNVERTDPPDRHARPSAGSIAGEITPLDLIDAAERRDRAKCEPAINALPTLCLDRAREHAKRLMRGEGGASRGERGWLARPAGRHQGPDRRRRRAHHLRLADLPGPRAGGVASRRRAHRAQGRHRHRQVEHAGVRRRRLDLQRGVRAHTQSLEHGADLRRLDRRRRGGAGGRRGVAGPGHGPCRQPAAAGDLLLRRRPAPVARPRDARHVQQSVLAAVGAGADGAQRRRTWRCSSTRWRASARAIP